MKKVRNKGRELGGRGTRGEYSWRMGKLEPGKKLVVSWAGETSAE